MADLEELTLVVMARTNQMGKNGREGEEDSYQKKTCLFLGRRGYLRRIPSSVATMAVG